MNQNKQYEVAVDLMAQARLLVALSDNANLVSVVTSSMNNIQHVMQQSGYPMARFNQDSIQRYMDILNNTGTSTRDYRVVKCEPERSLNGNVAGRFVVVVADNQGGWVGDFRVSTDGEMQSLNRQSADITSTLYNIVMEHIRMVQTQ